MTETDAALVPALLVDGPSAGRVIQVAPTAVLWNVADPPELSFHSPIRGPIDFGRPMTLGSNHTPYNIDRYGLGYPTPGQLARHVGFHVGFHVGWSAAQRPGLLAILRQLPAALDQLGLSDDHLREYLAARLPAPEPDQPIAILCAGDSAQWHHDGTIRMSLDQSHVQGICACGWLTVTTSRRRMAEVMELAETHRAAANARHWARYAAALLALAAASTEEDERDWSAQGDVCAHVCGADPSHVCDARAVTQITHPLPSGGQRTLPLCGPCHRAESGEGMDQVPLPAATESERPVDLAWFDALRTAGSFRIDVDLLAEPGSLVARQDGREVGRIVNIGSDDA